MSFKYSPRFLHLLLGIVILTFAFVTIHLMVYVYRRFNDNSNLRPKKLLILDIDSEFSNERFEMETFMGEKLVHLDLKGAPPKMSYLLEFLSLIKTLGATGILVEYEDMFPYYGELEEISALNAYTLANISEFLTAAENNNLTVIPLIQMFGHMEFVLKAEKFQHLREMVDVPDAICPSHKASHALLHKMIDQVMAVHQNARYFHIGCDEVTTLGICERCHTSLSRLKWQKKDIYFNHVKQVAQYIISKYPHVRPILWGDEIIHKNEKLILKHKIPEFLDVMFWNYKVPKYTFPSDEEMKSYSKMFKSIWIASAFKGAKKTNQIVPDPLYHLKNNEGWMHIVVQWMDKIKFKGIVLTGWQRFHHFAVLCELLPVGIPSLALSLQFLKNLNDMNYDYIRLNLACNDYIPMNVAEAENTEFASKLKCYFPGFDVYSRTLTYAKRLLEMEAELVFFNSVHFTFYSTAHNYTHPREVKGHELKLSYYLHELRALEKLLREALSEVYDESTVTEWILTHVLPYELRLEAVLKMVRAMVGRNSWSRRPLPHAEEYWRRSFHNVCGATEYVGCNFLYFHPYDGR